MDKKFKNSLVLGKFFPPHKGHLHLIDTALENSDFVNVLVTHNESQYIPGELRSDTLKAIYKDNKNIKIHIGSDSGMPQHDNECDTLDEFYSHWIPFVYSFVCDLDVVFTSEDYGDDFAKYLGVEHYLVDKERIKYPVSGTKVRSNPLKYWDFIPKEIRHFFVKRVAIMGPESVGKSTLTKILSEKFNTNYVEEYGRTIFERNGNKLDLSDFIEISKGRKELECNLIRDSNKFIFCDTEDITTYIFSKMYYPDSYKEIEHHFDEVLKSKKYDIYILLKPNCEAIQDGTRQFLNEREDHYEVIKKELIDRDCNFIEIGGDYDNRLDRSIEYINSY